MIIYKITLFLSMTGWRKIVQPITAKETDKTFSFQDQITGTVRYLKKIKLMEVDSILRDSHERISLFTYCRENQIDEAKQLLEAELDRRVNLIKAAYEGLMEQYQRPVGYIYPVLNEYPMPESGSLKL